MYTSFPHPHLQSSSQPQHPPWPQQQTPPQTTQAFPLQTPELSLHRSQQIEYPFHESAGPQSENQMPNIHHRQPDLSTTFPYSNFDSQNRYQYPQQYDDNHVQLFTSKPLASPQPEYWSQQSQQYQIYSPQSVSTEGFSPTSPGHPWSSVSFGGKELNVSAKPFAELALAVNPSQLHASQAPHGNEDFEQTEYDDGHVQLTSGVGFQKSSPPPLSPSSEDQSGQNSLGKNHNDTPLALLKSMANLSTSTPRASHKSSPIPSVDSDSIFPNVEYGLASQVSHPNLEIKREEETSVSLSQVFCDKPNMKEETDEDDGSERPYQCGNCDKNFKRQYNLNAHIKTHSEERTHICYTCNRSFLRPYDLSRHQRIHTKVKPYKCGICSEIFIRNDAIWRHYRKEHNGHPDVPISRRTKNKSVNPNSKIGALVSCSLSGKVPKLKAKTASKYKSSLPAAMTS